MKFGKFVKRYLLFMTVGLFVATFLFMMTVGAIRLLNPALAHQLTWASFAIAILTMAVFGVFLSWRE